MPAIHRFEPKKFFTTFGRNEPALVVQSGDTIIVETRDSGGKDKNGNLLPDTMRPPADGFEYYPGNPLVGPIYVQEAEPGDALAIHIDKIALNSNVAWSGIRPNFGSLTGEQLARRMLLNDPIHAKFSIGNSILLNTSQFLSRSLVAPSGSNCLSIPSSVPLALRLAMVVWKLR